MQLNQYDKLNIILTKCDERGHKNVWNSYVLHLVGGKQWVEEPADSNLENVALL